MQSECPPPFWTPRSFAVVSQCGRDGHEEWPEMRGEMEGGGGEHSINYGRLMSRVWSFTAIALGSKVSTESQNLY